MRNEWLLLGGVLAAAVLQSSPAAAQSTTTRLLFERTGIQVTAMQPTTDGRRVYYVEHGDELWLYDVGSGESRHVATGQMGALMVSRQGDRLAFTRRAEGAPEEYIWTMPLDPATGLASGPAQRVSLVRSLFPAFSPDGRSIAYTAVEPGNGRRLAVIPATGGPVRVVADQVRAENPVWTPDGQWIYFGAEHHGLWRMWRVRASGGVPEPVVEAMWSYAPGLSPDGRLLAVTLPDQSGMFVSDISGRTLGTIPWVNAWFGSTQLLTWTSYRPRGLRAINLADGRAEELLPPSYDVRSIHWSPDGRRWAAIAAPSDTADVLVVSESGSGRLLSVPLPGTGAPGFSWSPDGRWIALTRNTDGQTLYTIDAASGALRKAPIGPAADILILRWTADSRRIRYIHEPDTPGGGPVRTFIRETGLDGADVLLAEIERPSEDWGVTFATDSSVLVVADSITYLRSLETGRSVRLYGGPNPGPMASPSGRLFTMRPRGPSNGNGRTRTDVVTATGELVTSMEFPAGVGIGVSSGIRFTRDETHVLTSGRRADGECCSIYMAPLDGGPVRVLAELPDRGGIPPYALSPDGRTLLVGWGGEYVTRARVIDVSAMHR